MQARRLAGAALVIAMHGGIVAFLLLSANKTRHQTVPRAERMIWLQPLPAHKPHKPKPPAASIAAQPAARQTLPDYRGITFPAPATPPNLSGLNRSLFGCTGQSTQNLSAEERARCAGAPFAAHPDDTVDFRDHSDRAREAALWARGRARKNAPLLLPCMNPQAAGISLWTLLCLGKGAAEGFDLDNQPGYGDTPEQIHVPNNGDAPDHPQ